MAEERLHLADRLGLTIGEAAAAIGVSERHFRTILPEVPHLHVGRRVVIPVDGLREWLREEAESERGRVDRAVEEVLSEFEDEFPC